MCAHKLRHFNRYFCQKSNQTIKSFDEIPGTKGPLGIGTIVEYLPIIGRTHFSGSKVFFYKLILIFSSNLQANIILIYCIKSAMICTKNMAQ